MIYTIAKYTSLYIFWRKKIENKLKNKEDMNSLVRESGPEKNEDKDFSSH